MWHREKKSEIKSLNFQQWETQSCESLPHYCLTWMVKTSRKCPTDNLPVSGVLRVKALFLPSRLFYHPYLYNSTCTTLPVFAVSHTCRKLQIRTFIPLHFRLKLPNRGERKEERKSEERGKIRGCIRGQNHASSPKHGAKQAFFRES